MLYTVGRQDNKVMKIQLTPEAPASHLSLLRGTGPNIEDLYCRLCEEKKTKQNVIITVIKINCYFSARVNNLQPSEMRLTGKKGCGACFGAFMEGCDFFFSCS